MILNSKKRTVKEQKIYNGGSGFDSQEKSFCPECREELVEKAGKHRIWHFSHKRESECQYGAGMSEWHQRQQLKHHEAGWQLEVNTILDGETFRLDAFKEIGGEKHAREFIHTFCDSYVHKDEMLKKHNYIVDWIVDPETYDKITFKNIEQMVHLEAVAIYMDDRQQFKYITKNNCERLIDISFEKYFIDPFFFRRAIHEHNKPYFLKELKELGEKKRNLQSITEEYVKNIQDITSQDYKDNILKEKRKNIENLEFENKKILDEIILLKSTNGLSDVEKLEKEEKNLQQKYESIKTELRNLIEENKKRGQYCEAVESVKNNILYYETALKYYDKYIEDRDEFKRLSEFLIGLMNVMDKAETRRKQQHLL